MQRNPMLIAIACLAVAVAACGGTPAARPAPPSAGGSSGPTAIDSCTLLSDAEIEAATGQRVVERTASTLTQVFPSVCDIELDGGGSLTISILASGGRSLYETSFEPFIGDGTFAPLDEAVPGVGDKAARSGSGHLMVLAGDVLFDVLYIEHMRPDRQAVAQYLAEIILAKLGCLAAGCPGMTLPPSPAAAPVTAAPTSAIGPGDLPATGAKARVVNLYTEDGAAVALDVYAFAWSDSRQGEAPALVATVPYGQSSDWFDPSQVDSPYGEPYTKVVVERHGVALDPYRPLAGTSEPLGAGTTTTIAVWQQQAFSEPSAYLQTIYAAHPDYPIPQAPAGSGLLITRGAGLLAESEPPILYASVGDGCLVHPLSDPSYPSPQPIANDLVVPAGEHTLTLHEEPLGELPTCTTEPVGPGAPLTVAPGDRWLVFPYRLDSKADVSLLVIPFDAP